MACVGRRQRIVRLRVATGIRSRTPGSSPCCTADHAPGGPEDVADEDGGEDDADDVPGSFVLAHQSLSSIGCSKMALMASTSCGCAVGRVGQTLDLTRCELSASSFVVVIGDLAAYVHAQVLD